MSVLGAFSNELLIAIFINIDSVAQLAQCRLVCTQWNKPATKIIFGRKISVKSEEKALKLYRHLFRDPSITPLIKHMHFELDSASLPFVIVELLHEVFTPNIERLTGSVKADKFFSTLFDISDNDPSKFDHLKSVPKYTGDDPDIANNQYLKFKNAVHTFTLTVYDHHRVGNRSWSAEFDQFPNMTTFTLKGVLNQLHGIESHLIRCHNLQTLNLLNINYSDQTIGRLNKEQVTHWAASNVSKENLLRTVNVEALVRAELIEYLLFKYPNVTDITVKGELWFPTNNGLILDQENLNRILDAVKTVRQKHITLILPADIKMKSIIEFTTTRDEDIRFTIEQINDQSQLVMKIN